MRRFIGGAVLLVAAAAAQAAGFTLSSPTIKPGSMLTDAQVFKGFGCEGKNVSPALKWSGAPSGFAYVWLRCDATGGACAPIAGATANTYVPGGEDSGMTIRVAVTGSNTVSSQQAISLPSAPIP